MNKTDRIYLLLGTNQGAKLTNLLVAHQRLLKQGLEILSKSKVYVSEAWGHEIQDDFLNQVLQCSWDGTAIELLSTCQQVETSMGRIRVDRWGPRIIDVDILYINDQIISTTKLEVPHPRIKDRLFTLMPLVEIAEHFVNCKEGLTQRQLLERCSDTLKVNELHLG